MTLRRILFAPLLLVACGGTKPPPDPSCTPGAAAACTCATGRAGTQICQPDQTLGACGCPRPDLDHAWVEWPLKSSAKPDLSTAADVVSDRVTGLDWQRAVPSRIFTWPEAQSYCAELQLAGHADWRLPHRIELVSIVDYSAHAPALDPVAFPATPPERFWSISPSAAAPGLAWVVDFADGGTDVDLPRTGRLVRCVR